MSCKYHMNSKVVGFKSEPIFSFQWGWCTHQKSGRFFSHIQTAKWFCQPHTWEILYLFTLIWITKRYNNLGTYLNYYVSWCLFRGPRHMVNVNFFSYRMRILIPLTHIIVFLVYIYGRQSKSNYPRSKKHASQKKLIHIWGSFMKQTPIFMQDTSSKQ